MERLNFYYYRTPEELYDYEKDHGALNNLAEDLFYQEILQKMRNELKVWMKDKGDFLLKDYQDLLLNN